MIRFEREGLVEALESFGEYSLAARVPSLSEDEIERIGARGYWWLLHGPTAKNGASMIIDKALTFAAIEELEGGTREPKFKRRKLKKV